MASALSIHSALDDVERKKHTKDPFSGTYLAFCCSDLAFQVSHPAAGAGCLQQAGRHSVPRSRRWPPAHEAVRLMNAQSIDAAAAQQQRAAACGPAAAAQQGSDDEEGEEGAAEGIRDAVESAAAHIHARIEVRDGCKR